MENLVSEGTLLRDTLRRMPSKKRKKVALYFDEEQLEALRKISKRTKIPASVIVREGVGMAIKKYRKKGLDTSRR